MLLALLLPSQHAVKHKLLGPSVAQSVEAHNMSVVVRQLVVLVAVAAQAWVAAFVLVLCWPVLSRLLVVPVAAIGSLTVGPMEPTEQHAGVVVVVPWLQHSPAVAQHQRPLCSGAFARTVLLRGPGRQMHTHVGSDPGTSVFGPGLATTAQSMSPNTQLALLLVWLPFPPP